MRAPRNSAGALPQIFEPQATHRLSQHPGTYLNRSASIASIRLLSICLLHITEYTEDIDDALAACIGNFTHLKTMVIGGRAGRCSAPKLLKALESDTKFSVKLIEFNFWEWRAPAEEPVDAFTDPADLAIKESIDSLVAMNAAGRGDYIKSNPQDERLGVVVLQAVAGQLPVARTVLPFTQDSGVGCTCSKLQSRPSAGSFNVFVVISQVVA